MNTQKEVGEKQEARGIQGIKIITKPQANPHTHRAGRRGEIPGAIPVSGELTATLQMLGKREGEGQDIQRFIPGINRDDFNFSIAAVCRKKTGKAIV